MRSEVVNETTTKFDLGGFQDDPATAVERLGLKQRVFGCLVQMATDPNGPDGGVQHFHSDFYHDASWLDKWLAVMVVSSKAFYFGFDSWGTAIGDDVSLVHGMRTNTYKCVVFQERGYWYLTMQVVGG